jgi:chaperonin GroES
MSFREYAMKIRPLHDYIIVRRKAEMHHSAGGILIPDSATEKPVQGEVLAVGTGRITKSGKILPLDVKTGDEILFGKFGANEIIIEGETLLIMHEKDVFAVVNN